MIVYFVTFSVIMVLAMFTIAALMDERDRLREQFRKTLEEKEKIEKVLNRRDIFDRMDKELKEEKCAELLAKICKLQCEVDRLNVSLRQKNREIASLKIKANDAVDEW